MWALALYVIKIPRASDLLRKKNLLKVRNLLLIGLKVKVNRNLSGLGYRLLRPHFMCRPKQVVHYILWMNFLVLRGLL